MIPREGYIIPRARVLDMFPGTWNGESETSKATEELHGFRVEKYNHFFIDQKFIIPHSLDFWDKAANTVLKNVREDPDYFENIWRLHQKRGGEAQKLARGITERDLSQHDPDELVDLGVQIRKAWLEFNASNVAPWLYGSDAVKDFSVSKFKKLVSDESEIEVLFEPNKLSLTAEEEIAVVRAALEYKDAGKLNQNAERLSRDFGWIPFGYDGPTYWDEAYYEKKSSLKHKSQCKSCKRRLINRFKN